MMGLADEIGPYDGIYVLSVQADGPWTIEIE